jgi:ferritin heavy chain
MSKSLARQNFHTESEDAINQQINLEFSASYAYQALAAHFDRDDVALPGFAEFFLESAKEEQEHAGKFIKYITQRGGRLQLKGIDVPEKTEFASGLEAVEYALDLEKKVNQALLDLHKVGASHDDAHLTDYLEGEFLGEQVEAIKKLSDYVTNLRRNGPGLGEYLFDRHTLKH